MGLTVSTNLASINAQKTLAKSQRRIEQNFSQLSSGNRITKSADDAAGLSISEKFKAQIRSYRQAQRNAQDGVSMIEVTEGGLNEVNNILIRLRELGIQAASDTVSNTERSFINKEVDQLKNEIQRISETTKFGETNLLDGSGDIFDFQVDINNDDFRDRISFNASATVSTTSELNIEDLDFSEKSGAQEALAKIDNAQVKVSGYRANLGALQNRLVSTVDNIAVSVENLSAAKSRISDTDIAEATANLAKNNILLQASTSTLSQANVLPSQALKLIG